MIQKLQLHADDDIINIVCMYIKPWDLRAADRQSIAR